MQETESNYYFESTCFDVVYSAEGAVFGGFQLKILLLKIISLVYESWTQVKFEVQFHTEKLFCCNNLFS